MLPIATILLSLFVLSGLAYWQGRADERAARRRRHLLTAENLLARKSRHVHHRL